MKVLVALAVCIVAASAYVRRPIEQAANKIELVQLDQKALALQFHEYGNIIELNKLIDLVTHYVQEDEEVRHHWNYIFTTEFIDTFAAVQRTPEFKALLKYIYVSGIDIYTYVNIANRALGIDLIVREEDSEESSEETNEDEEDSEEKDLPENYKIGEGMKGLLVDFKAAMPYKQIYAIHDKKMLNECPYALFMNRVFAPALGTILENLFRSDAYENMVTVAIEHKIDVVRVRDLAHAMMAIDRNQY